MDPVDLHVLPANLPVPSDDGAASHLTNLHLPAIVLPATDGSCVDLSQLNGLSVLYLYPMTGRPGAALPETWDAIPGARGCTPQSCAFRDHFADLRALGVQYLYGISVQSSDDQREAAARLHLPFPLLSDECQDLATALRLPTFEAGGRSWLARMTMIVRDGVIERVFYPVFPPDQNALDVISALRPVLG